MRDPYDRTGSLAGFGKSEPKKVGVIQNEDPCLGCPAATRGGICKDFKICADYKKYEKYLTGSK